MSDLTLYLFVIYTQRGCLNIRFTTLNSRFNRITKRQRHFTYFFCAVWSCRNISLERADFYKTWYVRCNIHFKVDLTTWISHYSDDYELEDRNSIFGRSNPVLRRLQTPIKVPRLLFWNPSGLYISPAEQKSAGFEVAAAVKFHCVTSRLQFLKPKTKITLTTP